jgi:NAD(P)H-dependent flavin oxidoreductase YrpB (nitropropane dioxygenase family)
MVSIGSARSRCPEEETMLRTPLCDVLGIEVPIIGAPYGPFDQVDLAAVVCSAGALGSLGTAVRPVADLRRQWARMRELTDRPFAVNHTLRPLNEEAFQATLDERPAATSLHLGVPADLVERAHDTGILWIQQVMDVQQAEQAVSAGVDVIVAQGGETGGQGVEVATWCWFRRSWTSPQTFPSSLRAGSPTGGAWRRR